MNVVPFALAGVAFLVSACGSSTTPWMARQSTAAEAPAGARSLVMAHFGVDRACAPLPLPDIAVESAPRLGTVSVAETTATVADPGGECDGRTVPAAGIFYEAPAGAAGIDRFSYVEMLRGAQPDRTHTLHVRVR